ncbi:HAMP domain-containing histidine kinase [Candidatus Sumerlaeota bacterium]|nr:HAMP domain-containing histidine kinase [Candidatus Sumerlaeota bacterium]
MIEPTPDPESAGREHSLLPRLLHRARMINHIHDALQSSLNQETLYTIIAATMISHRGMGFSRALVFRYDAAEDCYRVCAGFGSLQRAAHERILKELEEEEELDRAVSEPEGLELEWINEEALFQREEVDVDHPAFWTRIAEKYEPFNPILDRVRHVTLSRINSLEDTQSGSRGMIAKVLKSKSCTLVTRAEVEKAKIAPELKDLLLEDSLWASIRTRKGPHLLLIADKLHEDHGSDMAIDEIDQLHMDWFCGQVATTVEKAELFSDLKDMNESLKNLDTLKSNFLSTVSHELRSPLTAITGFTRLLANNQVGPVTERQKEILDRVLTHGEKLTNIINDLIEIAEIDAGITVNINIKPVDPLNVLMETLPKLDPRKASKQAEIEPIVESSVPMIRADEKRLGRVFYHLIDNAIKFSRDKGKVRIEFVPMDKELAIRIVDAGIGIPPEKLNAIFESFYQIDNRMSRAYEGMGIGLTLTHKLVAGTGGRLKVESQLDVGTTFTIIYPIVS